MKKLFILACTVVIPFFSANSQIKPVPEKKQITYNRIEIKDDRGMAKDKITLKRTDGNITTAILKHNAKIGFIVDGNLMEEKAFLRYLERKNSALNSTAIKTSASINTAGYDHVIKL